VGSHFSRRLAVGGQLLEQSQSLVELLGFRGAIFQDF